MDNLLLRQSLDVIGLVGFEQEMGATSSLDSSSQASNCLAISVAAMHEIERRFRDPFRGRKFWRKVRGLQACVSIRVVWDTHQRIGCGFHGLGLYTAWQILQGPSHKKGGILQPPNGFGAVKSEIGLISILPAAWKHDELPMIPAQVLQPRAMKIAPPASSGPVNCCDLRMASCMTIACAWGVLGLCLRVSGSIVWDPAQKLCCFACH